jgi:hypothetical protein
MRSLLLFLGFLAAILIVGQLVMGLMLLNDATRKMAKAHQHSGYLTVAVSLIYITMSMISIASSPRRDDI